MAYKGLFKPKHPEKYKGNIKNIVYRSSWEMAFMLKLDHDVNILEWQSEEFCIPYTDPTDNSYHRYFPDFWYKDKANQCYVIEIKPSVQTKVPKRPTGTSGKAYKRFITEAKTFARNQAKWESAQRYCVNKGWTFLVLTEKELGQF